MFLMRGKAKIVGKNILSSLGASFVCKIMLYLKSTQSALKDIFANNFNQPSSRKHKTYIFENFLYEFVSEYFIERIAFIFI